MVSKINALTRNGVKDFQLQRISAIILGLYTLFLLFFCVTAHPLTFAVWHTLFANQWMKFFTFIAILSLIAHAWVGVWTIFTDYVTCSFIRNILMVLVVLLFLGYVFFGVQILWS